MEHRVACCYLTHDHPEIIGETLKGALPSLSANGIDVFVYDDSADDATKAVIEDLIGNGYLDLHYVDAHKAVHGDHKMLLILQGYGLPEGYDYIWPVKDRIFFDGACIDRLRKAVDGGYDVIQIADESQRWDISVSVDKDEYTDIAEFYLKYVMIATDWEGTVRKRLTMLDPIDWERYEREYGIGIDCSFIQPMSLFARLAEVDSPRIKIVNYERDERTIVGSQGQSWRNVMYETWLDKWITYNFRLPAVYDPYKLEAIRSQTGLYELFGSPGMMMEYHDQGLFTMAVYEKYLRVWPMVTDIPQDVLCLIAEGRKKEAKERIAGDLENAFKEHDYMRVYRIRTTNFWLKEYMDDELYEALGVSCIIFRKQMLEKGACHIFDGASSLEEFRKRFRGLSDPAGSGSSQEER